MNEIVKIAKEKMGLALKQVRQERGFSLDKAVELSGLGKNVIHSIETGTANYTIESFIRYMQILDVHLELMAKDEAHNVIAMAEGKPPSKN
jgi:transcriptional regulator with XRE-family HTH domain